MKPTIEQARAFRKQWSHKPTAITAESSGLWYSEECTDALLVAFASQETDKPLSIEERVQQAARQIAMWAFDELPINPAQEILLAEGCKAILRRHFGDLGARPGLMPSCHICGKPMKGVCESCGATTGVAPAESQPPLRVSIPEGHTFSNVSINGAKVAGAQGSEGVGTPPKQEQNTAAGEPSGSSVTSPSLSNEHPQSEPPCRVKGCGKLRSDKIHYPFPFYSEHAYLPERRIRVKEKRKHEEELNPAGNRFRIKGQDWWESAHINIRTGPPDRRQKWAGKERRFRIPARNGEYICLPNLVWIPDRRPGRTWDGEERRITQARTRETYWDRSEGRWAYTRRQPSQDSAIGDETSAQPGKKEGIKPMPLTLDPEEKARVQEQINHASQMSGIAAAPAPQVTAPQPQVTAEWVKSYRHQLLRRDDATETAALSSWSDAEVAAFASSLLAERDRTIAELRTKSEHYRVEAINQGCKREQAEQERAQWKEGCRLRDEAGTSLKATAERLRGLLREVWTRGYCPAELGQRIQKELEGRP